jgi:predicted O-methyltransferase YrrM
VTSTIIDTPVPIHQFESEIEQLIDLYRELAPMKALEIGTYDGGTFYHWLKNAAEGALVVSVDLYDFEDFHDNRGLYRSWTPKGVRRKVMAADSTKLKTKRELRKLAPFDFAFIDGDHSYETARSDFDLCLDLVRPGGIIALHDIVPPPQPVPWMQVDRLWAEITAGDFKTRQFVATTYQTWGGIGVVYV